MSTKKPTIWLNNNLKQYLKPKNLILGIPNDISPFTYWRWLNATSIEQLTEKEIKLGEYAREEEQKISKIYFSNKSIPNALIPKIIYPLFNNQKPIKKTPSLFAIYAAFIVASQEFIDVLYNFCLGENQIEKLLFYNPKKDKLEDSSFYFINICESYKYCQIVINSSITREYLRTKDESIIYHTPENQEELNNFLFSKEALFCPVDIWHDLSIYRSIFMSNRLRLALFNSKLKRDISLLSCNLTSN